MVCKVTNQKTADKIVCGFLFLHIKRTTHMVADATPIQIENKELMEMIIIVLHKEQNPKTHQTEITVSHGINTETNQHVILPNDSLHEFKRHFNVVQKGLDYYLNEIF